MHLTVNDLFLVLQRTPIHELPSYCVFEVLVTWFPISSHVNPKWYPSALQTATLAELQRRPSYFAFFSFASRMTQRRPSLGGHRGETMFFLSIVVFISSGTPAGSWMGRVLCGTWQSFGDHAINWIYQFAIWFGWSWSAATPVIEFYGPFAPVWLWVSWHPTKIFNSQTVVFQNAIRYLCQKTTTALDDQPRLACLAMLRCIQDNFASHFGIKCASFSKMNVGTSRRSACSAIGFVEYESVKLANTLLERTGNQRSKRTYYNPGILEELGWWAVICCTPKIFHIISGYLVLQCFIYPDIRVLFSIQCLQDVTTRNFGL